MAAGRCECICTHSEAKTFGGWPGVKKGSRKTISDRLIFFKRYRHWTAEDWGKVIFSDESPFRLFGASGRKLVRRRQGERYHQSWVMPTVKHPETIHVWGCFSAKGRGSLTIFPKNTAMNKECYQHILRKQLLPTIQEQFGEYQQNIDILGTWPGNSPDLNPIENVWSILKRRVDKQKPTNLEKLQALIIQERAAISQDVAQKLIDSMPGRIWRGLEKEGSTLQKLFISTLCNCQSKPLTLMKCL